MKKTKLLTYVSALILVISTSGCALEEQEEALENTPEDIPVNTPGEMISKIDEYTNYSLTFEYNSYLGTESITYYQYLTGEFEYDEVWASLERSYTYIFEITYTEDAVEADKYVISHYAFGDLKQYLGSYFFVNEENNLCWEYIYDALEETVSYGYGAGTWKDYCYSLATSYNYGVQNTFSYVDSFIDEDDLEYDTYSLNDNYAQYLFIGLGADFLFTDATSEGKNITHEYTNFYEQSQQMSSYFHKKHYLWNDAGTLLYPEEFHLYTTVHDVWNTDNSYAWSFHEYCQSLIFGTL